VSGCLPIHQSSYPVNPSTGMNIALKMVAVKSFEKLVNIYQTKWRNIPEESHVYFRTYLKDLRTTELNQHFTTIPYI
jgi:hypothetical protein